MECNAVVQAVLAGGSAAWRAFVLAPSCAEAVDQIIVVQVAVVGVTCHV